MKSIMKRKIALINVYLYYLVIKFIKNNKFNILLSSSFFSIFQILLGLRLFEVYLNI